jgi:hypothetical protein
MDKQFGFFLAGFFLAALCAIILTPSPAVAVKEFKDAFQTKYVKTDSSQASDVALAQAFTKASCTVCHVNGQEKKIRNDYGKELAKRVSKTDKKDRAKILAAMDTVAKLKSNPSDPQSPTFGEKIANGKLPAAN